MIETIRNSLITLLKSRKVFTRLLLCMMITTGTAHGQLFKRLTAGSSASSQRTSTATGYVLDPNWPLKSVKPSVSDHSWGEMSGLCLDHGGKIWAFHRGKMPVETYDTKGNRLKAWGEGQFGRPHQIRVDHKGHIWMADAGLHVVREFSSEGNLIRTFGTPGQSGQDSAHFKEPTDMAISPRGDLYIADGYGNNRVVQFDAEGRYVRAWGQLGSRPGEFNLPHSIAMDSNGKLYVADRSNARVQVFDRNGVFLSEWTGLMVPWHIVVTERDEVYVCGSTPMRWPKIAIPGIPLGIPPKDQVVGIFDTSGRMKRLWSFPLGQKPGEVDWLHAMAVDGRGNLYLGDIKGPRAQRFLIQDSETPGILAKQPAVDPNLKQVGAEQKP